MQEGSVLARNNYADFIEMQSVKRACQGILDVFLHRHCRLWIEQFSVSYSYSTIKLENEHFKFHSCLIQCTSMYLNCLSMPS